MFLTSIFVGLLVVSHFLFGLFTPYNVFTATYDILTNQPRYVQYEETTLTDKEASVLAPKYGFKYEMAKSSMVSTPILNGINNYGFFVNAYLDRKLGKTWKVKFEEAVDSLFYINRAAIIRKTILEEPLVKKLEQHLYCMSDGRRKVYVWVLPDKRDEANVRVCEIRPDKLVRIYYYYYVDPYSLKAKLIRE